jgi:hypothetical protein
VGSFKHKDQLYCSIKEEKSLDKISDYQNLKDSVLLHADRYFVIPETEKNERTTRLGFCVKILSFPSLSV